MPTRIAPMLAVNDGSAAIEFYEAAFGAELLWKLGEGADVVAGLMIDGAEFFLGHEAPEYGTRGPSAAGATEHSAVEEHEHPTSGPRPIRRMLQGAVTDPFGHIWLIGKFLES